MIAGTGAGELMRMMDILQSQLHFLIYLTCCILQRKEQFAMQTQEENHDLNFLSLVQLQA